ncbi:hypothetical protein KMW40_14625 [Enterobacter cloacae]|uniref:hypothetical protein n=1 Tax=Enterobacter cloacae TaxID=550 RepID=UPI0034A500D5
MKLPRYLKILLALTVILLVWAQIADLQQPEQNDIVAMPAQPVRHTQKPINAHKTTTAFVDLFPWQGEKKAIAKIPSGQRVTAQQSKTPALPFRVAGAWWSNNQRTIILTNGHQNWIVCHHCKAPEHIWIGDRLNHDWQLQEVTAGQLIFRWLPQQLDQHLALAELETKPTL